MKAAISGNGFSTKLYEPENDYKAHYTSLFHQLTEPSTNSESMTITYVCLDDSMHVRPTTPHTHAHTHTHTT